ncbi:hypothetical protein OAE97_01950 [Verrucomicrobia bacterium]|nr:hypothetical protein [Verrucomicrobiota bacterium]
MLNRTVLFFSLGLVGVLGLQAQVDISLQFKKEFYLAHESLLAEVVIINFSGKTLTFGQDRHWLQFIVEPRNGSFIERNGDLDTMEVFQIPNASKGIRRVHLVPTYKIEMPGSYKITAFVNFPELGMQKATPPVEIVVLSSTVVWKREIGLVRDEQDPAGGIDVRRYSLMRAVNRNKIDLYVKVTDKFEGEVFGIYSLGNIVSFGEPEKQVGRHSNLHVLMQNGARSFRYSIVKPDGKILLRQRWDYSNTRPRLGMDSDGLMEVKGGVRKPSFDDIPSPSQINKVREPRNKSTLSTGNEQESTLRQVDVADEDQ